MNEDAAAGNPKTVTQQPLLAGEFTLSSCGLLLAVFTVPKDEFPRFNSTASGTLKVASPEPV